ncbi:protease modulator HflC [Sphingomonas daechungensis]|uniref:Protein HflC n=1 Tax=Sphingomonas daechungensis TaxID=1176646 RepID=A0ABX6T394_9SPHN|nr:protease modulator HflC [Sphingomonas daechungensis]QNP44346.1 protease modulator HflC [Sphingomonas daechungensis]
MDFIRQRPIVTAVVALALLLVLVSSFPVVPETKQAVVVRFGKPARILNRYEPGRPIGSAGAGISWRIPFAEDIVWIDKRVQDVDMQRQQVLSTDQRRLEVDAFARYRIVDPLKMYIRARNEDQLRDQLRPILGSEVRNELGRIEFAALLTPERQGIMESVKKSLNMIASQYGAEIIDVRIKKTDLPDGTPLQSAYDRMRTARQQEARSIRAQGAKQAQIIRAEADADAAKTYAASFGKDADFYDFYRAMQSYQTTFVGDGQDKTAPTSIVLSPDNAYLKEFAGRGR